MSWQVKALEQRLGQTLFRRLPREVSLTAEGERLARAPTEAMNLLRAALADLTETEQGVLVISTLQSLASQWLAPRLGASSWPIQGIAVRLETAARIVDLSRENIDVALRLGRGEWPGLAAARPCALLHWPNLSTFCRNLRLADGFRPRRRAWSFGMS